MKILVKSASAITLSMLAFQAQADYNSRDYRARCQTVQNEFVLNKANVNTLVALSCGALSHTENERKQMEYKNSATLFHQWTTIGSDVNGIVVKGSCAIPLSSLKSGDYGRHAIDLVVKQTKTDEGKIKITALGSIAGKTMDLEFGENSFLDSGCNRENDVMEFNPLSQIQLGSGFGIQTLIDLVRSQRTGISLGLLDQEDWTQGRNTGFFSSVGLKYSMTQWNGRRLAISLVSDSANTLTGRSANILDWAESGNLFAIKKDSFGRSSGFEHRTDGNNHKFQAYGIAGGTQMIGCSALVFDGELDTSLNVDIENCKRHIEKSPLSKFTHRAARTVEDPQDSREEQLRKYRVTLEARKIQDYLNRVYGPAANYSDRPGVYEGGRKAWSAEDRKRGFVIQERNYTIDTESAKIIVIEHRSDASGNKFMRRYSVPMEKI